MFGLFFTQMESVDHYAAVNDCDRDAFKRFFHAMLNNDVYLAPSPFEAGFASLAHGEEELRTTFDAATRSFNVIAER